MSLEWPHGGGYDANAQAALKTQLETALGARVDTAAQRVDVNRAIYNSAGLAIKIGGSALVKSVNTIYGQIGATLITKAASDMAALSGTVTSAKFNVFVFMIDGSAALSSAMGTEGATLSAVVLPAVPTTKAVIGFVIINPTGTGDFVGGTTALDNVTVVPNAAYVNTVGGFMQPQ